MVIQKEKQTRKRAATGYQPTPEDVRNVRGDLTQTEAAALIYTTQSHFTNFECGRSRMHPGLYELLCIKTGHKKIIKTK